ncbi:hypothetical protein [Pseudoalteromonas prydzensis]|uniref:hypothetical protein n=1 Tax=Pseudoalteromonas prydzensis TaxID=182141 RepID=UPI003FD04F34
MVKQMTRQEADLFHKRVVGNAHKTEHDFKEKILARQEGIRVGWCHAGLFDGIECDKMIDELKRAFQPSNNSVFF